MISWSPCTRLYDEPLKESHTHTSTVTLWMKPNEYSKRNGSHFNMDSKRWTEFQRECVSAHRAVSHDSVLFARQTIPFDSLAPWKWKKLTLIKLQIYHTYHRSWHIKHSFDFHSFAVSVTVTIHRVVCLFGWSYACWWWAERLNGRGGIFQSILQWK